MKGELDRPKKYRIEKTRLIELGTIKKSVLTDDKKKKRG